MSLSLSFFSLSVLRVVIVIASIVVIAVIDIVVTNIVIVIASFLHGLIFVVVDVIVIAQDDQGALEVTKGALGHAKTELVLALTQGNFGCQKT